MSEAEVDAGAVAEESASDDVKRKAEERERKKAEVRKRLEESGKMGKKAKKGFLTPERKKKLRKLLMIKAAEDLKQQGLKREQERQKVLSSRIPSIPDIDNVNDKGQLEKIYNDLFTKMIQLEEEKYDINYIVSSKDSEVGCAAIRLTRPNPILQINELTIAVNDLRGKFVKPTLKKVSKYDNKFKKLVEGGGDKGPKKDFRAQLKVVKKENLLDEALSKTKKTEKPEWSKKGPGGAEAPVSPPKRGSVASVASVGKSAAAEQPPVAEEPEEEEEEEEEEEQGEEEE